MKVAFDVSPLTSDHKGRGVGTYTRELMAALKRQSIDINYVFTDQPVKSKPDLIHYPYFDLFFHTLPLTRNAKTVVTIHDVIPLLFSAHFPKGLRGTASLMLQRLAISSAHAVITDSPNSKTDISRFLPVPSSRIHPIPLAPSTGITHQSKNYQTKIIHKYHLPSSYLLYVGGINYNKNLPFLITSFTKLPPNLHLVVVSRASLDQPIPEAIAINRAITERELQSRVHWLSINSTKHLSAIYSAATAYIQPSLYEGFGLPLLEAFACSTPVIYANVSSLPEIAGLAAIPFNPKSTLSLLQAVTHLLSLSRQARQKLTHQANQHLQRFSWDHTATATIQVYQQVINS